MHGKPPQRINAGGITRHCTWHCGILQKCHKYRVIYVYGTTSQGDTLVSCRRRRLPGSPRRSTVAGTWAYMPRGMAVESSTSSAVVAKRQHASSPSADNTVDHTKSRRGNHLRAYLLRLLPCRRQHHRETVPITGKKDQLYCKYHILRRSGNSI
jgi:hypothetical protein